jgi:hypothetical protein
LTRVPARNAIHLSGATESCGESWACCGEPKAIGSFATRRLARKTVPMEALTDGARAISRAAEEIRTPVQSLAAHSRATCKMGDASFDVKSDAAESTYVRPAIYACLEH